MFDWNDEELSNIIWGDEDEADDHIVPYREGSEIYHNRKERGQESRSAKTTEQLASESKVDWHGRKVESISNFNSSSDLALGAWPESSVSKAPKTEPEPAGTEVSDNLGEIAKSSSTGAEADELDKGPEIYAIESKEQGDFVDWANIGSFDDLDRIFSNDDPLFGPGCLGSADELWSSSKDIVNSPLKPFPSPLDSSSLALETDCDQQNSLQFALTSEVSDLSSLSLQNACAFMDQYPGVKNQAAEEEKIDLGAHSKSGESNTGLATGNISVSSSVVDKAYRQKNTLKFNEPLKTHEPRALRDIYGGWPAPGTPIGHLENPLASPVSHSSSSILHSRMENPYIAAPAYGNLTGLYPSMPMLSSIQGVQSTELRNQFLRSSYDTPPAAAISPKGLMDTATRPLTMTPQEKIEKLRRRQQMQAMLAIQRQQQQFGQQVRGADLSLAKEGVSRDSSKKFGLADSASLDDIAGLPRFDPSLPLDQDDSITLNTGADDCPVEHSVLYRLQDVVSKLDPSIRLCIRDSLFRLAQSAVQRHHTSDTISTIKTSQENLEALAKEEEGRKSNRYAGMPDAEAETNPIDRTVAHLLFHRPLELSAKHPETLESHAPLKIPKEWNVNPPISTTPDSSKLKQSLPWQMDQHECSNSRIDASENASSHGTADASAIEVPSSQRKEKVSCPL